jgi:hypothetical protein
MLQSQVVAKDFAGVLKAITALRTDSLRIVAIDGLPGSGKSTLGEQVAAALGAQQVDFVDFLVKDQGEFVGALRTDELAVALTSPPGLVIASGVCMLQVLDRLDFKADVLVYVKRMAIWGWADEDEVVGDQLEELARLNGMSPDDLPLHLEVREYHREFVPHERADVVLERLEA